MNLDLNVFSSSNAERYVVSTAEGAFDFSAFSSAFDIGTLGANDDAFASEGNFDTNTFSSTSTTIYE